MEQLLYKEAEEEAKRKNAKNEIANFQHRVIDFSQKRFHFKKITYSIKWPGFLDLKRETRQIESQTIRKRGKTSKARANKRDSRSWEWP